MHLFDPALLALAGEQREFNAQVLKATAAMSGVTLTPEGLAWIRDAMRPGGLFGFKAYDFPEVREIPGPTGPLPIRVMVPEVVEGVYLHYHGGGMALGSALSMDKRNWPLAQACNLVVVSVDYRLAPEHPFPAGPDDAEAAALWLIDNAMAEFGTDRLLAGGESAGAYLTMVTMLRLRDRLGTTSPFAGLDLCYGVYDWGGTPSSSELVGKVPYATGEGANRLHYLPGLSLEQARDAAISPLWATLQELPPALLTVGTADWLRDDSIFLAGRLAAAGNQVELAVYPDVRTASNRQRPSSGGSLASASTSTCAPAKAPHQDHTPQRQLPKWRGVYRRNATLISLGSTNGTLDKGRTRERLRKLSEGGPARGNHG